jgi:hypothetical protein
MAEALPSLPFNGQIFIDAFRIKWEYDGECWRRIGTVPDVPVATELQAGLLTAQLKQLVDSIPEGAGHFGIITQPLLSLVPHDPKIQLKDKIKTVNTHASGTKIVGFSTETRPYNVEHYVGKFLIFQTGILAKKQFLIFTNDREAIYLEGDATAATPEDQFLIIDPKDLNPSGVVLGDITLVSETFDITCLKNDGTPFPTNCKVIPCDGMAPPVLNIQLNEDFLESLCITIPGCKGPRGDRGEEGDAGKDGTGDGPQGEDGDPGEDAPTIAHSFTGIKIVDVDDVHDTAVVAMELDAANNRLSVIKAKVRTPEDDRAATQLISTPIDRTLEFANETSFDYSIKIPPGDPLGTEDVDILKYPDKFEGQEPVSLSKIKLSEFVDKVIAYWDEKLSDINDQYTRELKAYIDAKDEAARQALATIAHELAQCEFQMPLEFCLGITPDDCHPGDGGGGFSKTAFSYPLANQIFGSVSTDGGSRIATDLGIYEVPTSTADVQEDSRIMVKYPDAASPEASSYLPEGDYIIQWISGAGRSSATDWTVGSNTEGMGVEAEVHDMLEGSDITLAMPVPSATYNPKEKTSVEFAYSEAPVQEKIITTSIGPSGGQIALKNILPGINGQGDVKVRVLRVEPA